MLIGFYVTVDINAAHTENHFCILPIYIQPYVL